MTLVELLVAMAVTAVVLVGLTGLLYDVTRYYEGWAARVDDASTGSALAAALQQDSQRDVPCHTTAAHLPQISFCVPGTYTATAVYTVTTDATTYSIFRQAQPAGGTILMARGTTAVVQGVPSPPVFWSECIIGPGTMSGHVHVYNFRLDSRSTQSFSVYYHAPMPAGGSCPT
jgi:hypothetical protein